MYFYCGKDLKQYEKIGIDINFDILVCDFVGLTPPKR